ncbi:hypothetical protein D9599_25745 [Roseomonas sp. KE2513]|uniref:hypothetical protein n=1 Tax=Roseomonas sp. KE2513 TaxID=2479202 RepID=UPI0018DF7582|nr:hypothetical protein [Roseomonas sp. KE2513]MBI0538961.1 hypothetical protein [Roseomonas sp. KE2513]
MGDVIHFSPARYTNALVTRLRRMFDEAAAEWKARGASAWYFELREDADRTVASLIRAGLPSQAVLRRTLRRKGKGA